MAEKLLIIDGNAIIHRAFHAIPMLTTSSGQPTNAIYGFCSMIMNLLIKERPEYIVIAYDRKGKTFRDDLYTEYKATRTKAPQELYDQMPLIKDVMRAFKIPQFEVDGFEADDIIATITHKMESNADIHCYIATGDRDAFQLITHAVSVITPKSGFKEYATYTPEKVKEEFGITPEQFCDYKTLRGDTSDNIPGVPGIGEKIATDLLKKYETIDGILNHLSELSPAIAKKMTEGKDSLEMSRKLVTLNHEVPIDFVLDECTTHNFDVSEITRLFEGYEFRSLVRKLGELEGKYDHVRKGETNGTLPLIF
ncbi:MAG: hypothetical protein NTX63_03310 [Candidatus Peregrinibacteria bacterium]|nr:hypothetical protein [Candidatus Peregrinibacteria bacterium]